MPIIHKIFGLVFISAAINHQVEAQKPNIVFILADDLGWADLPVYGNQFNEAPNITKLASQGMRFTNAYAACPVCPPTRASIMSGQYPARVIDFYPTFLELSGAKKPANQELDGISILPALLKNEYNPERTIYWHYPIYHHDVPAGAIRKGDWKLIGNLVNGNLSLFKESKLQFLLMVAFGNRRLNVRVLAVQSESCFGCKTAVRRV